MDQQTLITVGAAYGALQAVAQLGMLVFPSNTVAWRICKWLVAGLARPAPQ